MTSAVLARKYRPREFDALVGQEHVVQALANALKQRRLHHAYLFTGTRGVGKTTVARILAKSLNCVGADGKGDITDRPCGVCAACTEIDDGRFVDYIELDAASNRGVDEIGQLLAQAVYKPVLGRFKVYMIDEVHMLSSTAFNAMLKTLEEPPEYLKFVLATTDPQKVPATVLSRCLQFNLRPMAPPTIQDHLVRVLGKEGIDAESMALRLLARAARGSMRDALSLTDQAIAFGAGRLDEEGVRRMLGAVDRTHAVRIVEAISKRVGAAVVGAVDALRALGLSAAGTLDELCELLQRMAVAQVVPQALDESEPGAADVRRLAQALPADETQLLYSIVLRGRADLVWSPDEYSGLVMVLLRMFAFVPAGSEQNQRAGALPEPASANDAATPARSVAPVPPKVADPAPAGRASRAAALPATSSASAEMRLPVRQAVEAASSMFESLAASTQQGVDLAKLSTPEGDRWFSLVRQMLDSGAISALARELAMQAQCLAVHENVSPAVWRLRVERETLRAPAHAEKLQVALAQLLQCEVRLELEAGVAIDSPALREQAARERAQRDAEESIANDPVISSLLKQYQGARIVPGSIKPH